MLKRSLRLLLGLILFAPWPWRAYQAYTVAHKMPQPSIYEIGFMAIGAILILSLGWNENWADHLARLYRKTKAQITTLELLEIYPDSLHGINRWQAKIHNQGQITANNVRMRLLSIDNLRHPPATVRFPYPILRRGLLDLPECRINRGDDADFQVFTQWMTHDKFTTALDPAHHGISAVTIDPDECWIMTYDVTAENADTFKFILQMRVDRDAIVIEREN
jgi:hypothetical protein